MNWLFCFVLCDFGNMPHNTERSAYRQDNELSQYVCNTYAVINDHKVIKKYRIIFLTVHK